MAGLLSSKILYAPDDVRAIVGALDDHFQPGGHLCWIGRPQKQLGTTQNCRERIIDVVRNAKSKFTKRRHLVSVRGPFTTCFMLDVCCGDFF